MNIKIDKISIKNFKGIKDLEIEFNGKNANIFGDNATGKTTIFDAFLWALFNKNSAGKSDFEWKPLDTDGNEIHYLETTVELILLIDGNLKTLKKTASEKWVKKRGTMDQVYDGNETNYWIDEVPTKLNEYQRIIDGIIPEQKFKMITNPLFFNTQMTPDEQRTVISAIAEINNITDEKIMQENKEFTQLCEILKGRSIEDYMKITKETIKKLNDEIDSIPVRIDELTKTMVVVDERELKSAKDGLNACELQKNIVMSQIGDVNSRIQANKDLIALLAAKQKELENIKTNIYNERNLQINIEKNNLKNEISILGSETYSLEMEMYSKESLITSKEKSLEELRKKFDDENRKEFADENTYICPFCKREYDESQKDQMHNDAEKRFLDEKNRILEGINLQGQSTAKMVATLKNELSNNQKKYSENTQRLIDLNKKIENLQNVEPDYNADERYVTLSKEIEELEEKAKSITPENNQKNDDKLKEIQNSIDEYRKVIVQKETQDNVEKRIEELKQKEVDLAKKIQEQEKIKNSIEEFTKTKVALLEDKINENFELVKFNLFETQINGGVKEVCYATVDGVPFQDLNSAMKINAGLDIIKTLMKFYNVQAPVFIDNKETINNLINVDTQLISLIVSQDSKLRVEVI